jgi:hypothetical protein
MLSWALVLEAFFCLFFANFAFCAGGNAEIAIPFSITESKHNDSNNSEKRATYSFDLPTDASYKYLRHREDKLTRGQVSDRIEFSPSKDDVKKVTITVTLRNGIWRLFGGDSEAILSYDFYFARQPTENELTEQLIKEFNSTVHAVRDHEERSSEQMKNFFSTYLDRVDSADVTIDVVRARAFQVYQSYKKLMDSQKLEVIETYKKSSKFPSIQSQLRPLYLQIIRDIAVRIRASRRHFRPVAETYQLSLNQLVDENPNVDMCRVNGLTDKFVKSCYQECFKTDPDKYALHQYSMQAVRSSCSAVRDIMERSDLAFIMEKFPIFFDRDPTRGEKQYWLHKLQSASRDEIEEEMSQPPEQSEKARIAKSMQTSRMDWMPAYRSANRLCRIHHGAAGGFYTGNRKSESTFGLVCIDRNAADRIERTRCQLSNIFPNFDAEFDGGNFYEAQSMAARVCSRNKNYIGGFFTGEGEYGGKLGIVCLKRGQSTILNITGNELRSKNFFLDYSNNPLDWSQANRAANSICYKQHGSSRGFFTGKTTIQNTDTVYELVCINQSGIFWKEVDNDENSTAGYPFNTGLFK